jgi:hypothetical protein
MMSVDDGLVGYTLYAHPIDFPDAVVVRPWRVYRRDTAPRWPYVRPMHDQYGHVPDTYQHAIVGLCASIEEARIPFVARGLVRMGRDPEDDPVIVEVWL